MRFYNSEGGSAVGAWMGRADELNGMTPRQIQNLLGLADEPTHFVKVTVPSGTSVLEGTVAEVPKFGVSGGGYQLYAVNDISKTGQYTVIDELGEVFDATRLQD